MPGRWSDDESEVSVITFQPHARITGHARELIGIDFRRRYENGESIRTLAASTGRSYGFVHRVLSEAGVQRRGRGGPNGPKAKKR